MTRITQKSSVAAFPLRSLQKERLSKVTRKQRKNIIGILMLIDVFIEDEELETKQGKKVFHKNSYWTEERNLFSIPLPPLVVL